MRTSIVLKFCDFCAEAGIPDAKATTAFTVGVLESESRQPKMHIVDLCESCGDNMRGMAAAIEPLYSVAKKGRPMIESDPVPVAVAPVKRIHRTTPKPDRSEEIIPIEETKFGRSPSAQPQQCKLCEETFRGRQGLTTHIYRDHRNMERPAAPLDCPETDCAYSSESPQATAQHRRSVHGYDVVEEALTGVA